jgi:integrative and conjugative element protein (TIGR02256 family)
MQGTCWIRRSALEELLAEGRRRPLRETGGALLGHRDGELAVVETVLGPGPGAVHGYSHFEPDAEWQQREGERIYERSGRTIAFLGDWHTHPRGGPFPSHQDRETAETIADDRAFRAPRPLYGIASKRWYARRESAWRLRMLEWHRGELVDVNLITLE